MGLLGWWFNNFYLQSYSSTATYSDDFLINIETTGDHYFVYESNVVNRSLHIKQM